MATRTSTLGRLGAVVCWAACIAALAGAHDGLRSAAPATARLFDCGDAPSDAARDALDAARDKVLDIDHRPDDGAFSTLTSLLDSTKGSQYAAFRANVQAVLAIDQDVHVVARLRFAQEARKTLTDLHCDASDALDAEGDAYRDLGAAKDAARLYIAAAASIKDSDLRDVRMRYQSDAGEALVNAGDLEAARQQYEAARAEAAAAKAIEDEATLREELSKLASRRANTGAALGPRRVVNFNASDRIADAALCRSKNILATLGEGRQGAPVMSFAGYGVSENVTTLQLWDLGSKAALWNLPSPEDHVTFSPDCSLLASFGQHETSIVDAASGRLLKTFSAPGPVDFSPNSKEVWVNLAVFDLASVSIRWVAPEPKDPRAEESVLAVNFANDVYLVKPMKGSARVEIRHRNSSAIQAFEMADQSPATAGAISDDGGVAVLGNQKGGLCFYFFKTDKPECLQFTTSAIKSVSISKYGFTIAVRDEHGVRLVDLKNTDAERKSDNYGGALAAVSTREDGVGLWQDWRFNAPIEVVDFRENHTQTVSGFGGQIDAMTFGATSRELLFSSVGALYSLDFDRGRVRTYDLSDTSLSNAAFRNLTTSSDGQTIFASTEERPELLVFNRTTGRRTAVEAPHRTSINGFQVVSRDAKDFILSTDGSGAALLWNPADGAVAKRYAADNGRVTKLSISANGSRILSAGEDGALRLFTVTDGRSIVLKKYSETVNSIAISSDGRHVAACSDDHVDIWNVSLGSEPSTRSVRCSTAMGFVGDATLIAIASAHLTAIDTTGDRQLEIAGTGLDSSVFGVAEVARKVMYRMSGRNGGIVLADLANLWTAPDSPIPTARIAAIQGSHRKLSISSDAKFVLVSDDDGTVEKFDVGADAKICGFVNRNVDVWAAVISPAGTELVAPLKNGYIAFWDAGSCKASRVLKHPEKIASMAISADGTRLVTASADGNTRLFNAATTDLIVRAPGHDSQVEKAVMSPNGKYVVTVSARGDVRVWDPETELPLRSLPVHISSPDVVNPEMTFVSDTRLAVHEAGVPDSSIVILDRPDPQHDYPSHIGIWDVETGEEVGALPARSYPVDLFNDPAEPETVVSIDATGPLITSWNYHRRSPDFQQDIGSVARPVQSRDGKLFAFQVADGRVEVWDHSSRQELFSLILPDENRWTVLTPDGRFETAAFDQSTLVSWVLPSDPFRALPMEYFTADYFEGGLVPKVLRGGLAPVKPPVPKSLERPNITIDSVDPTASGDVLVKVKVARPAVAGGVGAKEKSVWPPVEVRLFRDGQLVAISDTTASRSQLTAGTDEFVTFPNIQVQAKRDNAPIGFTAYAFNPDGVRSDVSPVFKLENVVPAIQDPPRVYVVSIGVNASANPAWDLRFAAKDARDFSDELRARLTGGAAVVTVTLTSERGSAQRTATKPYLEQVFRCLATGACDSALLKDIPSGPDLRRARPQDFVVVFMASHGYRASDDRFYLFPYDVSEEAAAAPTPSVLQTAISGEMLRQWLLPLDSGQIVLILDTCDSQAAIDAQGFKSAPLLSRTFGQLAFLKGMKVLTATKKTESDDPALNHGWLTNRLLVDGLNGALADFDPRDGVISLTEWLRYGESARGVGGSTSLGTKDQQEPFLFDFGNWQADLRLLMGRIR